MGFGRGVQSGGNADVQSTSAQVRRGTAGGRSEWTGEVRKKVKTADTKLICILEAGS